MHIRHLLRHRGKLAATATAAVLPISLAWAGMATAGTAPQSFQLPAIKHVWVIELENEGLSQSFGDRAAYKDGGLIMITFDEGSTSQACCGETPGKSPSHPNAPEPGMSGPGGGKVGALLLSPFIKPGTVSTADYNHYSMLRTIEDIFGVPHLGDAAMPQVKPFGADVFTGS